MGCACSSLDDDVNAYKTSTGNPKRTLGVADNIKNNVVHIL